MQTDHGGDGVALVGMAAELGLVAVAVVAGLADGAVHQAPGAALAGGGAGVVHELVLVELVGPLPVGGHQPRAEVAAAVDAVGGGVSPVVGEPGAAGVVLEPAEGLHRAHLGVGVGDPHLGVRDGVRLGVVPRALRGERGAGGGELVFVAPSHAGDLRIQAVAAELQVAVGRAGVDAGGHAAAAGGAGVEGDRVDRVVLAGGEVPVDGGGDGHAVDRVGELELVDGVVAAGEDLGVGAGRAGGDEGGVVVVVHDVAEAVVAVGAGAGDDALGGAAAREKPILVEHAAAGAAGIGGVVARERGGALLAGGVGPAVDVAVVAVGRLVDDGERRGGLGENTGSEACQDECADEATGETCGDGAGGGNPDGGVHGRATGRTVAGAPQPRKRPHPRGTPVLTAASPFLELIFNEDRRRR